jgi:alkylation response protein AidB-like acyl-CoA dehydrogenase
VDFTVTDDLAEHRAQARAWFEANVDPAWAAQQHDTGTHHTAELHRRLARDGILGGGWPAEYGGTDVDPDLLRAIYRELVQAGMRMHAWMTTYMILKTIEQLGTEEQKQHFIGGALRGTVLIALGYTEPDSGSDVAAAKTAAVRDGDEWVVNGQKMFTSTAEVCSHVILLTRTNPELPKHEGLTTFLVPTTSAGYELQPIHTLGNQRTNTTFYTDVRVPDSARLAGVGEGWRVLRTALVYERGVAMPFRQLEVGRQLADWARATPREDGSTAFDDPQVAERIGRMATEAEVARLLSLRLGWMAAKGEMPGVEGSMTKLFRSEADQRHHRDALDVLGAEGLLSPHAPGAPAGGRFEFGYRASVVETIYGGSSEIMREMIAEGRLGLPRNRPKR